MISPLSNDTLSQGLHVLSEGCDTLFQELKKLTDPQLRHFITELESIRSFLKTLTLIQDTMDEERLRETLKNSVHSLRQLFEKIPPENRNELSAIQVDSACGLPDFLFHAFRYIGPSIRISKSEMKAWMSIDSRDAAFLTTDIVVQCLQQNGIVQGINVKKVQDIFTHSQFDQEIFIATGERAKQGKDGRIQYEVNVEDLSYAPKELESGQVSFKDIHLYAYVSSGDVIAKKIPPTPGKAGYTVTGRTLPPLPPQEAELTSFLNTKISEDGNTLIAAIDGCLTRQNGCLILQPTLKILGNVSYETGNIDSKVSVIIEKDVLTGFHVQSEEDVFVEGTVEGAKIEAKNGIVVKGGILGKDKADLEANGDISAKFISHATVSSLTNVIAEKEIINSKIWAGRQVILSSPAGEIVGGEIDADAMVSAGTIGSDLGVKTVIRLGGRIEELSTMMQETEGKIAQQEEIVDKCASIIEVLKSQIAESPTPSEEMSKSLDRARDMSQKAKEQFNKLQFELDGLRVQYEESMETLRSVRAQKNIMPGTEIEIQNVELTINEPTGPATIVKQGDQLTVLPYKELDDSSL